MDHVTLYSPYPCIPVSIQNPQLFILLQCVEKETFKSVVGRHVKHRCLYQETDLDVELLMQKARKQSNILIEQNSPTLIDLKLGNVCTCTVLNFRTIPL